MSKTLIGYVGGLALAAGVGAAVVASQGTANADTGSPDSASATESATGAEAGASSRAGATEADRSEPVSTVGSDAPDGASSVQNVGVETTRAVTTNGPAATDAEDSGAETFDAARIKELPEAETLPKTDAAGADAFDSVRTPPGRMRDLSAPEEQPSPGTDAYARSVISPAAATTGSVAAVNGAAATVNADAAAADVSWSPNPFRPMPPEPAPNDMPGAVWGVEQAILNIFGGIPDLAPFPRESFELVYRASQMVPWVNLIVPLSNVVADLPRALAGDKDASQRIVNNLVITIQPLAMAYYGYNELADVANLEQPALDFQNAFFAGIWDIADPFHWLHSPGGSGLPLSPTTPPAYPSQDGTPHVVPRNGWKAVEVISAGDDPSGDGFTWTMPQSFDGLGAQVIDGSTLRVEVNHEVSDGTISEVNLDLALLKTAIDNMINLGSLGSVSFVRSARQAFDRWTSDAGSIWTSTSDPSNTDFTRFCSGQSFAANTFGDNRGFVDNVYMTGEEVDGGRLFALDLANRDLYQVSGVTGSAAGGIGGMPFDSYENAALVDTGETEHVAILLSPDGGTQNLKLYIGQKGVNANGVAASDFLSRNGLAYGSFYYLDGALPQSGSIGGTFGTTAAQALKSAKLEDVDTSPGDPTRVVLGVQETGLFTFDLALDFSSGSFDSAGSSFTATKIQNHNNDTDGLFGDADNVDWTAPTALGTQSFPEGLIFVNEDSGTANGETWMMRPDGSGLMKIADTVGVGTAGETSGILDISTLVGYQPGSVLLTSNQGTTGSLTLLINPDATPAAAALPQP